MLLKNMSSPLTRFGLLQVKRGKRVLGTGKDWEKDAFQNDIDNLPETASLEAYEVMPVEAFGEAMLRGMGWSEAANSSKVAHRALSLVHPDAKVWMYLVYLANWTLNLRPLVVYP